MTHVGRGFVPRGFACNISVRAMMRMRSVVLKKNGDYGHYKRDSSKVLIESEASYDTLL